MKLYFSPGACSLAPHIVLREAGLPFELEKVTLSTKLTAGGVDFTTINPKGLVPVLELDDGQRLTEVPAVLQYLADQKPEAELAPRNGTMERYRLQEWLAFISTELHKQFTPLFTPKTPEEAKPAPREAIGRSIGFVVGQLEGKSYLMGERFTVADAYLFTVLRWPRLVRLDLAPWPAIGPYLERVRARPSVAEAFKAEGIRH